MSVSNTLARVSVGQAATETFANNSYVFGAGWIQTLRYDNSRPAFTSITVASGTSSHFTDLGGVSAGAEDTVYFSNLGGGVNQQIVVTIVATNADTVVFPALFGQAAFEDSTAPFVCTYTVAAGVASDTRMTIILQSVSGYTATQVVNFGRDIIPPLGVALLSPDSGQTVGDSRPLFRWQATSDTAVGVRGYTLQVASDSVFASVIETVTYPATFEHRLTATLTPETYYWRVIATDSVANADTVTAQIRPFILDTGQPVIQRLEIQTSASDYISPLRPNAQRVGDTVWFNPTGAGAGQVDTILVTINDVNETAVFGSSTYTALVSVDTGLNKETYTLVYQIPLNAQDSTLVIEALDVAGNMDTVTLFFRIDTTAPTAPALASPAESVAVNAPAQTFAWSASADTQSGLREYRLQADTNPAFTAPIVDSIVAANLLSANLTLGANDTWYWRVVAVDSVGNRANSDSRTLFIDTAPPSIGALLGPVDLHETNAISVLFGWATAVDTGGRIASYRLQADTAITFPNPQVDTALNADSLAATLTLAANDTWYWRVIAVDWAGNRDTSPIRLLVVDTAGPAAPTLGAPATSTETRATDITFSWVASTDSLSGLAGYRLQVDTQLSFAAPFVDSSAGPAVLDGLKTLPANDTYYWRVLAIDEATCTTSSEVRTLFVDTIPPVAGALDAPTADHDTNQTTIIFSWAAGSDTFVGIGGYRLQIDTQSTFVAPLVDSLAGPAILSETRALPANDTWYWRVVTYDRAGNADTAAARILRVDTAGPTAPALLAPDSAAETSATTVVFAWGASTDSVSAIASYRLQVSSTESFAILLVDSIALPTVLAETRTFAGTETYYWRVIATAASTCTAASTVRSFHVDTMARATLVAPADSEVVSLDPLFQWTSVSGETFTWQIASDALFASIRDSATTIATSRQSSTLDSGASWWRVIAEDRFGNIDTTAARFVRADSFAYDTVPPVPFTVTGPADATETSTVAIRFSWNGTTDTPTGLREYLLEASRSPLVDTWGAWVTPHATVTLDTTVTETTLLVGGSDTWYWHVVARDRAGNRRVSDSRVILVDTTPPSAPALSVPAANTETRITDLTFSWEASTDTHTGPPSYRLQIDTAGTFAAPYVDSIAAAGILAGMKSLPANETWHWRVVAWDRAGNSTASETRLLKTDTRIPVPGALTAPAQDAGVRTPENVMMSWQRIPETGPVAADYRIQVDTAGTFTNLVADISNGNLTNRSVTLPANDTYRWRIIVTTTAGCTAISSVGRFQIDTIPPVPGALVSPDSGVDTNAASVVFTWTAGYDTFTGLTDYIIEVSRDTEFTDTGRVTKTSVGTALTSGAVALIGDETMYWRVVATDSAGNTESTAYRVLRTDWTAPAAPGLSAPTDLVETNATTIDFSWTAALDTPSGLASYRLQIDTAGTFSTSLVDSLAAPSVLSGAKILPANDTYYWRIVATDRAGNATASATRTIFIDTICSVVLGAPADSAVQDSRPLFTWSGVGVETWLIQIDTANGAFTSVVDSSVQVTTLFQPTVGFDSGAYWWRVIATDRFGNRETSPVRFLQIDTALSDTISPDPFTVIAPADLVESHIALVRMSWNPSADSGSGLNRYMVEASTSSAVDVNGMWSVSPRQVTVAATTTETDILLSGTNRWYWHVVAYDNYGRLRVSDNRSIFIDTTPPTVPTLVTPANGFDTSTTTIYFEWTASTDVGTAIKYYRLQIDTAGIFVNPVIQGLADSTTLRDTVAFGSSDTYYWRVMAEDRAGCTSVSATRLFRTDFTPPTGLSLLAPSENSETNATTFTFRWVAAVDYMNAVTEYRLQIDTANLFTSLLVDSSTGLETQGVRTLPANATYYWRARVTDSMGNATATAGSKLVIDTLCVVSIVTPDSGAKQDSRPVFLWSGSGVETYVWQIDTAGTFAAPVSTETTTATFHQPAGFDSGIYYWRVIASDRVGNVDTSAARLIRIDTSPADTIPPNPFSVIAPESGHETSAFESILFQWNLTTDSGSGVASYTIELDTAGNFVSPWYSATLSAVTSSANVNLSGRSDTYWWRVVARDGAGCTRVGTSPRIIVADFSTPSAPGLVAPLSLETTATQVRFAWTAATDTMTSIAYYEIEVSLRSNFLDTVATFVSVGTALETTPLYLITTWDTFYWRIRGADRAGNLGTWSATDSFRRVDVDTTKVTPLGVQNLTATGLETSTILLTWEKTLSPNIIQYNIYFDTGPIGPGVPMTLFGIVTVTGENAYRLITGTLTPGLEYRFKVVAQDSWGHVDEGAMASAICRNSASNVPIVRICQVAAGEKLIENTGGIQVLAEIIGTPAQIASVTNLTFQYRINDLPGFPWVDMVASTLVGNNTNPITPANALTPFDYYRFVWDGTGINRGVFQVRGWATTTSGETGAAIAPAVLVEFVDPADTASEYSAIITDSFMLKPSIFAAVQTETIITTNNGDTQSIRLILPAGSFPRATDTAGVYLQMQVYSSSPYDSLLTSLDPSVRSQNVLLTPVGNVFDVTLSNGDTLFATPGTITLTYLDATLDGFIDGSTVRWSTVEIYSWSQGIGWERLPTSAHETPRAGSTTGRITAPVRHFSLFRLVGGVASADLTAFMIGPNPFKPNDGNDATGREYDGTAGSGMYFSGLPANVKIEIYSVAGRKVTSFTSNDPNRGQIQWDVRNDRREPLASGYYLYIITDLSTNKRMTGKFAVIR